MNVGQRIREVREELGMPQTVLARRVGVVRQTVARYESGDHEPSFEMLEKIARELRTEPAEFLREPVPLAKAPDTGPSVPPLPGLSLVALSFEELETRLFGAPVGEQEEPAPALTVEEAHQFVRAVRGERDAFEDWLETYAAAPAEARLKARADEVRAKERVRRARLYYALLLDYWGKLTDPRGVPFKGVEQFVSETAEARGLLQAIKQYQEELRRLEKGKAG
jgi:transcriptional regulator with XRE-family HTH domain